MDQVIAVISHVGQELTTNYGIGLSIGTVLFGIAKAVSNQSAGPFVSKLQLGVDALAKSVSLLGQVLQKASDLLSDVIKSDGILGKK